MGKRKSSKKPQGPKKKEKLSTSFDCLFCNHEKCIEVKVDKKAGVGDLTCKVCGQSFQTGVNYLSGAVDVYADWIDACDAVNKREPAHVPRGSGVRGGGQVKPVPIAEEEGMGDFVEDDEADAEGEYADE
jgi:transcription elongation factor Elf1